ncbi:hypothetical protein [Metabacillus fastidiosus]|uniref:hypothetical protein n=1 Tax=Metabacillus fastidiosus TaxID=1458 RepID=UPI002DBE8463|nr:hypothetical protein [Metabacillus fastidiosus]MEC2077071.1 hypothetical protein [Metabacillus fastidiosus]
MALTREQLEARRERLIAVINQLRETVAGLGNSTDAGFSIKIPPFLEVDLNLPGGGGGTPAVPRSIREFLSRNVGNVVQLTIPNELFNPLQGVVMAVQNDYVVLSETGTGTQNLVQIDKIETVSLVR